MLDSTYSAIALWYLEKTDACFDEVVFLCTEFWVSFVSLWSLVSSLSSVSFDLPVCTFRRFGTVSISAA